MIFVVFFGAIQPARAQNPLTIAESSRFEATSRYQDVTNFIQSLQTRSPKIRVETLATSPEGRKIPLVILGDPPPVSPMQLNDDPRMLVYIQANIHAGEVEGKEASLMLIRDLLAHDEAGFLDDLIILAAPIFNPDGNEKISPENRKDQHGPIQGVGKRANGQGLDLNRDAIKLESPEMRGLLQNVLKRWDPILLVDCHTTNGSLHEEPLTYSWQLNPNGDQKLLEKTRDHMMPALVETMQRRFNTPIIPYGNFRGKDSVEDWATYIPFARYLTNYMGLRNRMAILVENYAYADFKTRIMANYHYLISILAYCKQHKEELIKLAHGADRNTVQRGLNPKEQDQFIVDYDLKPLKDPITIQSFKMRPNRESSYPSFLKSGGRKTYHLKVFSDFTAKRSLRFPFAYLIPESVPRIQKKLQEHGIVVEKLIRDTRLKVESFQLTRLKTDPYPYQGHRINQIKGDYHTKEMTFPKESLCIRTAQPLGSLTAYLLEAESQDGLLAWNFFDRYLISQWGGELQEYPVYRLLEPSILVTEVVQ